MHWPLKNARHRLSIQEERNYYENVGLWNTKIKLLAYQIAIQLVIRNMGLELNQLVIDSRCN